MESSQARKFVHGSNGFKPKPSLRILSPSGAADGDTCLHGRWVPFLEAPVDDFLKKKPSLSCLLQHRACARLQLHDKKISALKFDLSLDNEIDFSFFFFPPAETMIFLS